MTEYKPNASRQTKGGKAMVSADELKSFRNTYGQDKTLRDLLNRDKGLTKKESKEASDSLARIQSKSKPGSGLGVDYKENTDVSDMTFKKGGKVSSASSRADGCAVRGKTRGMIR